jgi:hypothetical protein
MTSTLRRTRSDVSTSLWGTEPPMDEIFHVANSNQLPSKRLSFGKRALRALARFLIAFCIGIGATLAWQSYGDGAREMIAGSSPQLGWLAPEAKPAQTRPNMTAPAAPSADQQQLNALSLGLAAMRQSIDQLAAGQLQMTQEITKLRAAQQESLDQISVPSSRPAVPARKPVPMTPPSQAPSVR